MLDERKAAVLIALIEDYIRRGEAVSSTTVLETSGLSVSAATIRNDLAALEREGFVTQPHTSAGRIPTAAAYRWYVDHAQPDHLRRPIQIRIQDFFATVHLELGRLLKATSDLVSEVTSYPAIVLAPTLTGETIRGLNLVRMGSRSVLVVIVTDHGRVSQEVVTTEGEVDDEAVRAAESALAALLVGSAPDAPGDEVEASRSSLAGRSLAVFDAAFEAASRGEAPQRAIYVGGTSRMANTWEDLGSVHRVLEVLEREAMLLSIMASAASGTTIQIGEELPVEGAANLAVIASSYDVGGGRGRVGVLGPLRMDYRRTISVVEEVSDNLADHLGS